MLRSLTLAALVAVCNGTRPARTLQRRAPRAHLSSSRKIRPLAWPHVPRSAILPQRHRIPHQTRRRGLALTPSIPPPGLVLSPLAARPVARAHVAMMVGIEEAAADCLEEGCEIGTVESLLEQMKAEKNPSTKMLMTIKRLEFLIKSPEDNASDIEKLVSAAARSFSVVDTFNFPGEPIGYTGKVGTTTTAGKSLE